MKAKINHIYATIINDKCHQLFTIDELPEWCDITEQPYGIKTVDVTGNVPNIGDKFDGKDFTAPAPIVAPIDADQIALNAQLDKLAVSGSAADLKALAPLLKKAFNE